MFYKLKIWYCTKILKRQYIISKDYSNGIDFGCKVNGYRDKNDKIHITNVKYF